MDAVVPVWVGFEEIQSFRFGMDTGLRVWSVPDLAGLGLVWSGFRSGSGSPRSGPRSGPVSLVRRSWRSRQPVVGPVLGRSTWSSRVVGQDRRSGSSVSVSLSCQSVVSVCRVGRGVVRSVWSKDPEILRPGLVRSVVSVCRVSLSCRSVLSP